MGKLDFAAADEHSTQSSIFTECPKSIEDMDASSFQYGEGDPRTPHATMLHQSNQGELKARNRKGGANDRAMSRVLLITIYQFWEDHYRQEFARALGKEEKDEIKSDFFGDIRHMRNGIIHHRNRATADIRRCKILKLFAPDEEVYLTSEQAKQVMRGVREALDDISKHYLGVNGGFA